MKRGEIWWVAFDTPQPPGEPAKARPAVILQIDPVNASQWQSILVVPATTELYRAELPFCVLLPKGKETGLRRQSVLVPHWLTAASKSRFVRRLGRLPSSELARLEAGVAELLGLGP